MMWRSVRGLGLVIVIMIVIGHPAGADEDNPPPDPTAIFADGVNWKIVQPPQATEPRATESATQTPAPTLCDGRVTQAAPGEGEWTVAFPGEEAIGGYLCHSETGERRDVLPPDFYTWRVYPSPDENYLLLAGRSWTRGGVAIYSYRLAEDRLQQLGDVHVDVNYNVDLCRWLTPSTGLLCTWTDNYRRWPATSYYSFAVTRANSVAYAFHSLADNTLWLEDQQRYVTVNSTGFEAAVWGETRGEYLPCTLTYYDADGLQRIPLGYYCTPIRTNDDTFAPFYRHGDVLYYLTMDRLDATVATLRRFDTRTGQGGDPIFTGEIDTILDVSPDEKFIAITLNDNGSWYPVWELYTCCLEQGGRSVVILHEGRIVYRSENIGVYLSRNTHWIDEKTLIVIASPDREWIRASDEGDSVSAFIPPTVRRISFAADEPFVIIKIIEAKSNLDFILSPDGQYILTEAFSLFNLETFELIPILREGVADQYGIWMLWEERGSTLRVTTRTSTVEYRVTLP